MAKITSLENAILNTLRVNMAYKPGEEILLVGQLWNPKLGEGTKERFEMSYQVTNKMFQVLTDGGYNPRLSNYVPNEARNGVDATDEMYKEAGNPDIVFMPTAFSLTHTPFRKMLSAKGARIASMPTFTLEMFEEGGPMSADYLAIKKDTEEIAKQLKENKYARVRGELTDMVIEIEQKNVAISDGIIDKPGECGNLPGAEVYVTPSHLGNSHGYFTIPVGFGGQDPIKYAATFFVDGGRIVEIENRTEEGKLWIKKEIKPLVLRDYGAGENFDVLAELGIGANPAITFDYIQKHGWSTLLAEKIMGSAHFANGNSKGMGGLNDVRVHIDWVVPDVQLYFFGK